MFDSEGPTSPPSVNSKLLDENLHRESLIAHRLIHNDIQSYNVQAHDLDVTRELLHSVSSTRKHYQSQKEKSLTKEKSSEDCQLPELHEEILKLNTKAMLLKSTISDLQKSSDDCSGIVGCSEKLSSC